MITREEVIKRLEGVAKEIAELKAALEAGRDDAPLKDATAVFLEKCRGWEDPRTPEEIVADVYAARTRSHRGEGMFPAE